MPKKTVTTLDPKKLLVAPSILAADFASLGDDIRRVEQGGCDLLHLDIMDGHFVPNLTMGPPLVKSIRKISQLCFDVHLMLSEPINFVEPFAEAGADHITFHIECRNNPADVIAAIRKAGCSVGLCLKPRTPASTVIPYLDQLDLILVMSVEPGFGGQSFMSDMMGKVAEIRTAIKKIGSKTHLEIDGGIDRETVKVASTAGANMMVAGTSVFRNPAGAEHAIRELHDAQRYLNA
ncbi:MAG: ribulose-phosphate 3-epimerase [Lentisphaerae bacterium GWF2_52_8]|nr:MAG: ribulose-phosphate 3-epimerase [Lentisphaerae bacterium GWF2_52_8]